MKSLALLSLLVVCQGGCNKATELLVVFSSGVDQSKHPYDSLVVNVTDVDTGESSFSNTYSLTAGGALPASLDLHADHGTPTIEIEAALMQGSVTVVDRKARLSFVSKRSLELRIEFEDECAGVVCSAADQTCIDENGCVPDMVDPNTLPSISPSPLAPVDMASTDLAAGSDLATGDMAGCPAIPGPPTLGATSSCTLIGFAPDAPKAYTMTPSNATVEPICGDRLHITMPIGTNTFGSDFQLASNLPQFMAMSGTFTITAGYWASTNGNGFVGERAVDSNDKYYEFATSQATGNGSTGDRWVLFSDVDGNDATKPIVDDDTDALGTHVMSMQRSVDSQQQSTYALAVTAMTPQHSPPPQAESPSLAPSQTPTFFVGNYNDGTSNAIEVQLAWVEICPE